MLRRPFEFRKRWGSVPRAPWSIYLCHWAYLVAAVVGVEDAQGPKLGVHLVITYA